MSELTQSIKSNLENAFPIVKVKGEITNLRRQASGHIYFSLKDQKSQVSAVLFQGHAKTLSRLPKDGDQVLLEGELSVYAPRGTYQIIARKVDYDGVGDLLLKLHQLKEELQRQGYFAPEKKKPLPAFPKTIGVITSPTGAVIQDILNVLTRRSESFHLILYPVKVQGEGAAEEIAIAIDEMNRHNLCDLLIIGRGGGSLEDLMPFNERCVADSIFQSNIPIISAVGHETDFSISDYVADLRAPTPSAAAEIAMKEKANLIANLSNARAMIKNFLLQCVKRHRLQIERIATHPKFSDPYYLLGTFSQKVDDIENTLTDLIVRKAERARMATESKKELLERHSPMDMLNRKRENLQKLSDHLHSVNPKNILQKGYCIPFREKSNSVIISTKELSPSQKVSLLFHDGSVETIVEEINITPGTI